MKILFITAGVLPVPVTKGGAVETLVEYIIDENEVEKKLDIDLISYYDKKSFEKSKKYKKTNFYFIKRNNKITKLLGLFDRILKKIKLQRFQNIENYDYLFQLKKIVQENNYDKIIVENRSPYINYLKKITKDKLYLHLHNDYLNIKNPLADEVYNNCDGILTVSDYIKKCVYTINKNDTKTKTLINCTDTDLFNKEKNIVYRSKLREQLNISEKDFVFLYSGRLTQEKGIKELLKAFKNITDKSVKLLVLGSSWYGSNIKNKFQIELEELAVDLKDKIIFTGFIDRDNVARYHSIADVAIVPSMWEEPAGLVVLEAQASGMPVILTDSGGIPELANKNTSIIIKRDTEIIEKIYEAMNDFVMNKNKSLEMGKEARKNAEKHNKKYYYNNFIEIMKEI
ncbi:glycosyltransferase family 4 protein [Cetobacterium somerae]|uniref:glycosyltransferase family 4 protein n=1 Tax=Cetobacterium sp. NK01 TaxID=2993530 RepID=UPI0021166BFE|nr:glycosyltransferase family 4 protein [Cetobacterium sp. NK01]MCQ8212125.1 glycosyltransferase family 4 protein [Cetobacterium sp. NK01]